MAVYIDWTFYSEEYLGKVISEDDFSRLALRASAIVDRMTFNRAAAIITDDDDADLILQIQNATCAIAEEMEEQNQSTGGQAIASEKVGDHSVSYVQTRDMKRTPDQKLYGVAKLYLGNTGLMYRGFASGELGGIPSEN